MVPLVKDGKNRALTWANRHEYMQALFRMRMHEFDVQLESIAKGMNQVIPCHLLSLFTWNELEAMVCGRGMSLREVDLLEKMTSYSGHRKTDPHIINFWKMLRSRFDEEERAKFLTFVWGRSRLPTSAADFSSRFTLSGHSRSRSNPDMWLPIAHTCGFSMEFPKYSNIDIMTKKVITDIRNLT
eukprot:jgi/Bigna1/34368/e_gw1.5.96.1